LVSSTIPLPRTSETLNARKDVTDIFIIAGHSHGEKTRETFSKAWIKKKVYSALGKAPKGKSFYWAKTG
jgi:hypothetical protein